MIHILAGNNKIGMTSNISLPPVVTCPKRPCRELCYARKFYKLYPVVKTAWDDNWSALCADRSEYFISIRRYLLKVQPQYFRWHVAGDIVDQDYLDRMIVIAMDYRTVRFLCFTKMHDLDFSAKPSNLSIVLSVWPGVPLPDSSLPLAFVDIPGEFRAFNTVTCKGSCEDCRVCWNPQGRNILLEKH